MFFLRQILLLPEGVRPRAYSWSGCDVLGATHAILTIPVSSVLQLTGICMNFDVTKHKFELTKHQFDMTMSQFDLTQRVF